MNKPAENINQSNDEYFDNLEVALERALNNSKLFEFETITRFGLYFRMICCEYLHCELGDLFEAAETMHSPKSIVYATNIIPFVRLYYRDMNHEIVEIKNKLEKINSNKTNVRKISACWDPFDKNCELVFYPLYNKKEGIFLPTEGIAAIEDEEGFRMVVYHNCYGVTGKDIHFKIVANIKSCDYKIKIKKFREDLEIFCKAHPVFRSGIYKPTGDAVDFIEASWSDLKISPSKRREIDFHIVNFIEKIRDIRSARIKTNRGIVLYGKPGNGKTLLGRILASTMDVPIIQITPKDVTVLDTHSLSIKEIYEFADMIAPCIVFIEDGDIYLNERHSNHANRELLSEFLNCMDGLRQNNGVLTILTANNPELLDEAVKDRPKRFDVMIELCNPGAEERKEIIRDIIRPYLGDMDECLPEDIAFLLEGFSGAHVCEFAERLVLSCIYQSEKRITMDMVNQELEKFGFKPLRSREQNAGFVVNG